MPVTKHDEAVISSNILIPESRVNAILDTLDIDPESNDSQAGSWGLDVMIAFSAVYHIWGQNETGTRKNPRQLTMRAFSL